MSAAPKTLIERLRSCWRRLDPAENDPDTWGYEEIAVVVQASALLAEAAHEIERLRAALERVRERINKYPGALVVDIIKIEPIIEVALTESSMAPAAAVRGTATPSPPEGVEAATAGASRMHPEGTALTAIADKLDIAADLTDCERGCAADALRVLVSGVPFDGRQNGPFLVADGGAQGEHRYRTLVQGISRWTLDPQEALWFARRRDAELYAAEDEDAWCILPVSRGIAGEPEPQSHDAPPGGSPQRSRTGTALAVTRARQIDGDAADPRANTITELCDRLDRIDRIAHDTTIKATERLRQIMEWSGGFAKVPHA